MTESVMSGYGHQSIWSDLGRLHKWGIYTLALVAFLALWGGNAFGTIVAMMFLIFGAACWFWESPRVDTMAFDKLWTLLTTLVIGLSIFVGFNTDLSIIEIGVYFILYLTAAKLFQRARLIDHAQILALSFLLIAASTAFNDDLMFGIFFAIYVIVGVVTFAIHHLRMEIEANIERGGRPTRVLFGRRYLAVLVTMALLTFAAALVFFFLFPRLGFGFFATKARQQVQQSGFSENVDLGSHGAIKADNSVVMRVQFPNGDRPSSGTLYWRGLSFDRYDGIRWSRTLDRARRINQTTDGSFPIQAYLPEWGPSLVEQEIYIEPMDSNIMFGLDKPIELRFPGKEHHALRPFRGGEILQNETGDLRYKRRDSVGYLYNIKSFTRPNPSAQELQRATTDKEDERLDSTQSRFDEAYLQLPANLDDEIKALAESITRDATNDFDRAGLIASYLRTNLTYTTDLPPTGDQPPLSAFLLTNKRGHCEYFATAMVIMLRSIGIKARNVNGFLGGQWNNFDGYLAVRNSDAHSWTEVFLGSSWVRFDPTPSAANVSERSSLLDPFSKVYDALRFKWFKYVIEYDLSTQIELLKTAGRALGASEEQVETRNMSVTFIDLLRALKRNLIPSMLVLLISLLAGAVIRVRKPSPLDRWDALISVAAIGASATAAALLWKPEAGSLVRIFAVGTPSVMLLTGFVGRLSSKRSARRRKPHGVARIYIALRSLLSKHGVTISPTDGPETLLETVRDSALPDSETAETIITAYMNVRFGGTILKPAEERQLSRDLKLLSRTLAKASNRSRAPM